MPASSRPHIVSAAACVFIGICGSEAGRVVARGRMLLVDDCLLGWQLWFLLVFYVVSDLWHRVWPMPASSRLHIDSAGASVFIGICGGGAGHV
jgi:hypothetical protein